MRRIQVLRRFWFIVFLSFVALVMSIPKRTPLRFSLGPLHIDTTISIPTIDVGVGKYRFIRDLDLKKGLDLQGGTQIVLEAVMDNVAGPDRKTALDSAKSVIARRIDLYGISETVIQTAMTKDAYRIIVELPGVTDPQQARALIGQTAKLDFREPDPSYQPKENVSSSSADAFTDELKHLLPTGLTGKDLERASVQFDQESGSPVVSLTFTDDGRKKFADITERNIGRRVGIFLDNYPLTIPVVQTAITDGQAIISGGFTTEAAKQLTVSLNAGALPVDLRVVSQTQIGATLGEQSITQSAWAGIVGLSVVAVSMILWYGWLGVIADIALLIYTLLTISVYKLLPITITLPGIAGFLLSIGMATDANILIFERLREELRRGQKLTAAIELGFGRAWSSIKDANISTLITAFVLYNPFDWKFLNSTGLVRGFALTLAIGIGLSLFTGIVVSRTLIRTFYLGNKKQ